MLDYYDRCYDHELQRRSTSPDAVLSVSSVDLESLSAAAAADQLLASGLLQG